MTNPGAAGGLVAALESRVLGAVATGRADDGRQPRWWMLPLTVLVAGALYGAVLGSWDVGGPGRWLLMPYAAVKAPLVILCTTAVCLPGYSVLGTVLGLRADLRASLSAIGAGQAATALALASLAPLTRVAYSSGVTHTQALVFAGVTFALATAAGAGVTLRRSAVLLARSRRHRLLLGLWVAGYVFVGVQTGWMLRPFVGTPGREVTFFRPEPWSNAYVAVGKIVAGAAGWGAGGEAWERR